MNINNVAYLEMFYKTLFSTNISVYIKIYIKKKLQKSVIFYIFGIFGLKTTSDHKSEVLKVAFKFDFTSENSFLNLK